VEILPLWGLQQDWAYSSYCVPRWQEAVFRRNNKHRIIIKWSATRAKWLINAKVPQQLLATCCHWFPVLTQSNLHVYSSSLAYPHRLDTWITNKRLVLFDKQRNFEIDCEHNVIVCLPECSICNPSFKLFAQRHVVVWLAIHWCHVPERLIIRTAIIMFAAISKSFVENIRSWTDIGTHRQQTISKDFKKYSKALKLGSTRIDCTSSKAYTTAHFGQCLTKSLPNLPGLQMIYKNGTSNDL
jgi:hypothetical protein